MSKKSKTAIINKKLRSSKSLSASIKLIQDELLPNFSKVKNFENNFNLVDNNVKLLLVNENKWLKNKATIRKLASDKLSSISIKFILRIRQDVRAKKVLILKVG